MNPKEIAELIAGVESDRHGLHAQIKRQQECIAEYEDMLVRMQMAVYNVRATGTLCAMVGLLCKTADKADAIIAKYSAKWTCGGKGYLDHCDAIPCPDCQPKCTECNDTGWIDVCHKCFDYPKQKLESD